MGQINAVQSYYLFFKETNAKVDEIVKEYRGLNPDEIFAQANKEFFYGSKDIEKANQLLEEIASRELSKELQAYNENHCQDISFLGEDDNFLPEIDI